MTPEEQLSILLQASDEFSGAFAKLGRGLNIVRNELAKTGAEASRSSGQTSRGLAGMGRTIDQMGRGIAMVASRVAVVMIPLQMLGRVFGTIGRVVSGAIQFFLSLVRAWGRVVTTALKLAAVVGVTLVGALAMATKTSINFETSMLRVGGVLGKTLEQMEDLQRTVREVAKTSTFRPGEIAGGGAFALASAGFDESQISRMAEGVTKLAEAFQADFGPAAELTATILRTFGMRAEETNRVVNVLAAANAKSAATFDRLYAAMPKAATAAQLVGMSFEEMTATIMLFENAGIHGEQAGAALRMMITNLLNPAAEAVKMLKDLGISTRDVNPAVVGWTTALRNLQPVLADSTRAAMLFSRTGLMGAVAVAREGVDEIDRLRESITGTNQAFVQAAIQTAGVAGQWKFLMSSLEELQIAVTEKVRPELAALLSDVSKLVNALAGSREVRAFANALGLAARQAREFVGALLGRVDLTSMWPKIIAAVKGYLLKAVYVISTAVATAKTIIAAFSQDAGAMWSGFWVSVVKTVVWAGKMISGLVWGIRAVTGEALSSAASEFPVMVGTIVKQSLAVVFKVLSDSIDQYLDKMRSEHYGTYMLAALTGMVGEMRSAAQVAEGTSEALQSMDVREAVKGMGDMRKELEAALPATSELTQIFQKGFGAGEAVFGSNFIAGIEQGYDLVKRFTDKMGQFGTGLVESTKQAASQVEKMVADMDEGELVDPEKLRQQLQEMEAAFKQAGRDVKSAAKEMQEAIADPTRALKIQLEANERSMENMRRASQQLDETLNAQIEAFQKAAGLRFGALTLGQLQEGAIRQQALDVAGKMTTSRLAALLGRPGGIGDLTPDQIRDLVSRNPRLLQMAQGNVRGMGFQEREQAARTWYDAQVQRQVDAMQDQVSIVSRANAARVEEMDTIRQANALRLRAAEMELERQEFLGRWNTLVQGQGTLMQQGRWQGPTAQESYGAGAQMIQQGLWMTIQSLLSEANATQARLGQFAGHGQFAAGRQ